MVELAEAGDLPSQSPVIKVFDFVLQMCKVATGPKKEGAEPGRDRFDGVFFAMPNHISLCIQINNIWGLIRALALMITGDPAIFQPLDPFGRAVDSIAQGDVEVGDVSLVGNVAIRGSFELIFIVLNMVMQAPNLLPKVAHFGGSLGFALSDG